jgi:hypothetical protein
MSWLRVRRQDFNMEIQDGFSHMVRGMIGASPLTMLQRHMIAVVVSTINKCRF